MRHPDLRPLAPLRHPCPCGSGKKFKNCCVDEVSVDDAKVLATEARHPGFLAAMVAALNSDPQLKG